MLDRLHVPIGLGLGLGLGLGSGISGVVAAKKALGVDTEITGVVSSHANANALSFTPGEPIATNSADTLADTLADGLADGLAVRTPSALALSIIRQHVTRIVSVDDVKVLAATSHYFTDTHNVAEGAGAASLAALMQERAQSLVGKGQTAGVVLTGGNIDKKLYRRALLLEAAEQEIAEQES